MVTVGFAKAWEAGANEKGAPTNEKLKSDVAGAVVKVALGATLKPLEAVVDAAGLLMLLKRLEPSEKEEPDGPGTLLHF